MPFGLRPWLRLSLRVFETTADTEHLPSDGAAGRGTEEHHEVRDLLRLDHGLQGHGPKREILHLLVANAARLGPIGEDAPDAIAADDARRDRIDPDLVG